MADGSDQASRYGSNLQLLQERRAARDAPLCDPKLKLPWIEFGVGLFCILISLSLMVAGVATSSNTYGGQESKNLTAVYVGIVFLILGLAALVVFGVHFSHERRAQKKALIDRMSEDAPPPPPPGAGVNRQDNIPMTVKRPPQQFTDVYKLAPNGSPHDSAYSSIAMTSVSGIPCDNPPLPQTSGLDAKRLHDSSQPPSFVHRSPNVNIAATAAGVVGPYQRQQHQAPQQRPFPSGGHYPSTNPQVQSQWRQAPLEGHSFPRDQYFAGPSQQQRSTARSVPLHHPSAYVQQQRGPKFAAPAPIQPNRTTVRIEQHTPPTARAAASGLTAASRPVVSHQGNREAFQVAYGNPSIVSESHPIGVADNQRQNVTHRQMAGGNMQMPYSSSSRPQDNSFPSSSHPTII